MTTAFIFSDQEVLLMKRSMSKNIAPGMHSGVGGHIEPNEQNTPRNACLREIFEETGLKENQIIDFKLHYIILRQYEDEIRQQFVYFGVANTKEVRETNEGELLWVNYSDLFDFNLTTTARIILRHYFGTDTKNEVMIGTVSSSNENPSVHWAQL